MHNLFRKNTLFYEYRQPSSWLTAHWSYRTKYHHYVKPLMAIYQTNFLKNKWSCLYIPGENLWAGSWLPGQNGSMTSTVRPYMPCRVCAIRRCRMHTPRFCSSRPDTHSCNSLRTDKEAAWISLIFGDLKLKQEQHWVWHYTPDKCNLHGIKFTTWK